MQCSNASCHRAPHAAAITGPHAWGGHGMHVALGIEAPKLKLPHSTAVLSVLSCGAEVRGPHLAAKAATATGCCATACATEKLQPNLLGGHIARPTL